MDHNINTSFAPVIIPTLNRYEHFKRCLESLEKCSQAEKTNVYVALDYPPSDKYVEGWRKIDLYLAEKEKDNGFGNLIVIRRERNYGVGRPGSNCSVMRQDVSSKYDRYIITEDDNEFSPCFLEYMNQNLEKYKDDDSVFRVCGYLPFSYEFDTEYSQFIADRHVAWGIGHWTKKEQDYRLYADPAGLRQLFTSKSVQKYFEADKLEIILISLVRISKRKGGSLGDVVVDAYKVYKNKRCIFPTKSMVRNHGWDGSGLHGGYVYGYKEQEIQTQTQYVMNEAPYSFTKDFEEKMHMSLRNKKRDINGIQSAISWYMYKYSGIYCEFTSLRKMAKHIKSKINRH